MWLAHALTLVRVPLIAVFWVTEPGAAWVGAIVVAAVSDALDGRVARRARRPRPPPYPAWWSIGGWLDPLVDRLFVFGLLAATLARAPHDAPLVLLVALRDLLLVPLVAVYELVRHRQVRLPVRAHGIGKATTVVQLIALAAIILHAPGAGLLAIVCAVLGAVTIAHYVIAAIAIDTSR
jgi:phosphatidylglycerophosphate synthase